MRAPCAFRYYSQGKMLVAISNKVRFTNGDVFAPLQVHLALTGKETDMRVMWVSAKGITPHVPFLRFVYKLLCCKGGELEFKAPRSNIIFGVI